jgi:hypothetical protein
MLDHSADDWGSAELHSDPEADPSARVIAIVALRKRARRHLQRAAGANAIVRPAPGRDDRRDSDVAEALAGRKATAW